MEDVDLESGEGWAERPPRHPEGGWGKVLLVVRFHPPGRDDGRKLVAL